MPDLAQLRLDIREQQELMLQILREYGARSQEYGRVSFDALMSIDSAPAYATQRINRISVAIPKIAMLAADRPYAHSVQSAYEILFKSIPNEKMADLIAVGLKITDDEIDLEAAPGHISPGWSLHEQCFSSSPRWEEKAFPMLVEIIGKEIPKALVDSAYAQAAATAKCRP